MLPEDPKIDMAKILLFIFAFILVFLGHTTGLFFPSDEQKQHATISFNLFKD